MQENYLNINFTTSSALWLCDAHSVGRAIENILSNCEFGDGSWAEVTHMKEGYEVISVYKEVDDSNVPMLIHDQVLTFANELVPVSFRVEKWDAVSNEPDVDEGRVTFFHVILDEEVITIN